MACKQRSIMMSRSNNKNYKKKINGIVKLKNVVEKLMQKSLLLAAKSPCSNEQNDDDFGDDTTGYYVPEDVKEGHFAVIAVDDGNMDMDEPPCRRFVVPLTFLEHPRFLKLLEQAAEEYGFDHDGALMVPCRPSELEIMILAQQWRQKADKF